MTALLSRKKLDEDRLAELGYSQELRRDWSMLHNFGVSFSIIVRNAYLSPGFLKLYHQEIALHSAQIKAIY